MSDEQFWVIQTADLAIGTILSFDLTDTTGQVLHKAGMPINDRLKARLQKNNIHSVTIRGATHFEKDESESLLVDSFEAGRIESIQETFERSQVALRQLVLSLQKNEAFDTLELRDNVNDFVDQACKDVAAALAALALPTQKKHSEISERLTKRSAKLSFLGVITSVVIGLPTDESCEIGLAGMLHDCSLLMHPNWFSNNPIERGENFLDDYHKHSQESVDLLKTTVEVSENVLEMIGQVHEQADGSGYPRQLSLEQTHQGASILNLADAYLTLVEPIRGSQHAPSDSLAYLCYQAAQGKFSKLAMQAMLHGMSIYPVGSSVILDDESKAIVVAGNPGNPLEPVVRLFQPGNLRIDLAESSRTVIAPYVDAKQVLLDRIPKSRMHEVLWRTDR